MPGKFLAEEVFRLFLDSPNSKEGDSQIFYYVLDYLSNFKDEDDSDTSGDSLSEDTVNQETGKGVLLEDFSSYELDDFLYFYLEDNFENYADLQKQSVHLFRRFLKFATAKKFLGPEDREEWEEVLEG